MLSHILEIVRDSRKCNHRHVVVLSGERQWGIAHLEDILSSINFKDRIVFTWKHDFQVDAELEELKNSDRYIGTNYDFLAIDLHRSFVPNDLGRLVSIVRGGGLIVLLVPRLDVWRSSVNYFHESILTPPYSIGDIRHNFIPWVIKNMMEHDGISIYEEGRWIKKSTVKCESKSKYIVDDSDLPEKIRGIAVTGDQVKVLRELMRLKEKIYVITADRGRGKSSVLGILTAVLIYKSKAKRIGVTAPDLNNLREFYRFISLTLERLGLKYTRRKNTVLGKKFFVEFKNPAELSPKRYDLLIVDEAAGIPVPLLLNFSKAKRVVYSTTVHGYEGTGRSFSIRFMKDVNKRGRVEEIEMKKPIRYASSDPVEKWIFDTLLLDSEPASIKKVDVSRLEYRRYKIEDLLKDERKLREYYGIFVLAHYRNNPNDLGIICDAPNQEIRTLEYNGHVVCSVQLAREGKIEEFAKDMYFGEVPAGNIIPDVVVKHYKNMDFAKYRGFRIVRIATHPNFMNMGIGAKMLNYLMNEDVDWIGSSFGATPSLLKFWLRSGFSAIHISPKINEKTGEHSVIVLKAISPNIKKMEGSIRKEFASRIILSLGDVHSSIDPEIARLLLNTVPRRGKIKLGDVDWKRLISYAWGPGNYEVTSDVIYRIAGQYFISMKVPKLNSEQERILIAKVLQHRSWSDASRVLGRGDMYLVIEMREIMRKFIGGNYNDEVSEFQRRFHGEDNSWREESHSSSRY